MAVITITSEYQTGSKKVAAETAKKLEFEYIGDQLVADIARELNISRHEADMFLQSSRTSVLRYLDRYTCSIVQRVVDREHGCLDDDTYFNKTQELVKKIYENDNAIILGWGAQCILKGKPETFHVFLKKDDELKIKEIMHTHNYSREGAEEIIKREEDDRKSYTKRYFKTDWKDSRLYDLVIDMGRQSVGDAVDMITENARHHLKSLKSE